MSTKKNHIPRQDYGSHVVTFCGRFPRTVEACFGSGLEVCKLCKENFLRTPEVLEKEWKVLADWGKSFNFTKQAGTCSTHPGITIPRGRGCHLCARESDRLSSAHGLRR